jgi:hypothetical protein
VGKQVVLADQAGAPEPSTTGAPRIRLSGNVAATSGNDVLTVTLATGVGMISLTFMVVFPPGWKAAGSAPAVRVLDLSVDVEHVEGLADHLVGEAPLVVVPAHDLDKGAVHDAGHRRVDHRCPGVADDVGGDDRVLRDA